MNAREIISPAIWDVMTIEAQANMNVLFAALSSSGFTIMSKEEVEAVREALEPFANRAFQFDGADDDWFCNPSLQVKHLRAADDAIRSLKSDDLETNKARAKAAAEAALKAAYGASHDD